MAGLDREQVREWYNGYNWLGADKVYNPYDVLPLLRRGEFAAHWFETGTPAFLVDTLFERRVSSVSLGDMLGTEELLSAFDVGGRSAADHIGTEALLFQTGYLTITAEEQVGGETMYWLGYPNRAVRQSLNWILLRHLVQDSPPGRSPTASAWSACWRRTTAPAYRNWSTPSSPASPRYQHNDIADYEGFYASVFYSYFAALGYDITVEESTSHGRLDMAVRAAGRVYLFEFKVAETAPPGSALAQLRERRYADKYRAGGQPIHLVGVEFSRATRNITAFETADA